MKCRCVRLFVVGVFLFAPLIWFPAQESDKGIYYSGGEIIFTPTGGKFQGIVKIRLEISYLKSHNGFEIPTQVYYTINGDTPSRLSNKLGGNGTIVLDKKGTYLLKARAFGTIGKYAGKVYAGKYVIQPAQTPNSMPQTSIPPGGKPSQACDIYNALLSYPGLKDFPVVIETIETDSVVLRGANESHFYSNGDDPVENFWENQGYQDKVAMVTSIARRITKKKASWNTYKNKTLQQVARIMNHSINRTCGK